MQGDDFIYARALEAIAMGATRDETRAAIHEQYGSVSADELQREMANALEDALKQGVEREDIDPSWF